MGLFSSKGNKAGALGKFRSGEEIQYRDGEQWLNGRIVKGGKTLKVEYTSRRGERMQTKILAENAGALLRKGGGGAPSRSSPAADGEGLPSSEYRPQEERAGKPAYSRGDKVMTKNGIGTVESVSGDGRIWVRIGQKTLKKYRVTDLKRATAAEVEASKKNQPSSSGENKSGSNRQKSLAQHGLTAAPSHGLTTAPSRYGNPAGPAPPVDRYQSSQGFNKTNMASANDFLPPAAPADEWGAGEVERWARITLPRLAYNLCSFIKDGRSLLKVTKRELERKGFKNSLDRDDIHYAVQKLKKVQKSNTRMQQTEKKDSGNHPGLNMFTDFQKDDFPDLPDEF